MATNAVKYGALSQPDARLVVRWWLSDPEAGELPWLHIDWHETCVDFSPKDSSLWTSGQGRELIEQALPYQLGARTTYSLEDKGVHCTIAVPLARRDHRP